MHCIAGLLHPVHGEIRFGDDVMTSASGQGKDKTFVPPQERNIAMVFQEYALYPNMTVRENMSFALKTKKAPKEEIQRRVDYMARMLSIEQLLDRRPAELSGGQRQRVALGRALVRDPQVFLLDEPLGNLDAKLRDQVRYELKKIQLQLGITTIYVTHDQTEAMTMADRIVLLKDGRIMQQGTPDDLYDHPANEFVAGFLGTPQINLFSCTVRRGDGGALTLDAGDFCLAVPDALKASLEDMRTGRWTWACARPTLSLPRAAKTPFTPMWIPLSRWATRILSMCAWAKRWSCSSTPGSRSRRKRSFPLVPNLAKLHLFDPETPEPHQRVTMGKARGRHGHAAPRPSTTPLGGWRAESSRCNPNPATCAAGSDALRSRPFPAGRPPYSARRKNTARAFCPCTDETPWKNTRSPHSPRRPPPPAGAYSAFPAESEWRRPCGSGSGRY